MSTPDNTYDTEQLRLIRMGAVLGHCWGLHGQRLGRGNGSLETALEIIEKLLVIAAVEGHQRACVESLQRVERWLLTLDEQRRGEVCQRGLEGLVTIATRTLPEDRAEALAKLVDTTPEDEDYL